MHDAQLLLLLAGALAVTALAKRIGASAPLMLVAVGLALSFVPAMPDFRIDPELVLVLFLPPLLYAAALESSYLNIKAVARPIGLLAVGLVLATTVVVGVVAHLIVPGLPLAAALVLGAVVAPPDAVAAVAIGRRLGLPRRAMTLLAGESLVNDATALTAYKVAVAAATGAAVFSWGSSVLTFGVAAVGGVAVGLVLGIVVHEARTRLGGDGQLESALGLLVPFGTYLLAEALHASGVLAVVVAGLYLGHNAPRAGYSTRLQETAVWQSLNVLLESLVFGLIGLQLRSVLDEVAVSWSLFGASLVVLATVIAVRALWMPLSMSAPRALIPALRRRDHPPGWRKLAVMSWAGMRGVVSLAAAAAIPLTMPGRDVVVFFTFVVTVGTLLIQGTTLPWLIRRIGFTGDEQRTDALAEASAQHAAARAAVDRLDLETKDDDTVQESVVDRLRALAEHRGNAAWERLGRQDQESPAASYRRLRRTMLEVEREVFVNARNGGEIDDEVLRRVLRELDLEEAALARE